MTTTYKNTPALAGAVLLAIWLSACSSIGPDEPAPGEESQTPAETHEGSPGENAADDEQARNEDLHYNLQRLDDPDYTQTYGDGENEKIWYSAAENLGQIGKAAIPPLIDRLESRDEFEVMLALYALQLASQDAELQANSDYQYLALPSVLNPRANTHNKAIALDWWQQYRHLWAPAND